MWNDPKGNSISKFFGGIRDRMLVFSEVSEVTVIACQTECSFLSFSKPGFLKCWVATSIGVMSIFPGILNHKVPALGGIFYLMRGCDDQNPDTEVTWQI